MSRYTPMLEQYLEIKERHKDAILFFRLGDFYEMFFEDARIASRELEIVLTSRESGEEKIPMCGVPYHSASNYIARLINKGYKVAICEQMEDPSQAKGIVKREVVRIITPGTVLEDVMLEEGSNNFLASVVQEAGIIGFAYIDVSTGEFKVTEWEGEDAYIKLASELERIKPAECLLLEGDSLALREEDQLRIGKIAFTFLPPEDEAFTAGEKLLLSHFGLSSLKGRGLENMSAGITAAAAILSFLKQTQKINLRHIRDLKVYTWADYVEIDLASRRNLELTSSLREGRREGSLLHVLDKCRTAMGKRMLKSWIEQPLCDLKTINRRLDAVEELKDNLDLRFNLKEILSHIYDLERIAGKIGSGLANPRDMLALKKSALKLREIKEVLKDASSFLLQKIGKLDALDDIYDLLDKSISEEAPVTVKEGNIIKDGYKKEIDELRYIASEGSNWLVDFENRERERTGIKNLKVGFNKVFGYYIEITKANLHLVPKDYHRKQTLVNCERFISDELKSYEDKLLGAKEKLCLLEYEEFMQIREKIALHLGRIQDTARLVAVLDVLYSLAEAAYENNYVRPLVNKSYDLHIKEGRHPVVEKFLESTRFVPNDLYMEKEKHRFAVITGPNMGGKSTFMRQTALIVLMAQIGSFVPAKEANIGLVDKIFTRVGAADDLAAGQSTFMVEMVEVANIVKNATSRSLVLLDEIGRGTSTYDGLSIARAVSEYIVKEIRCKTLFATHYHELTSLADEYEGIFNLAVSVKEAGENVIFLKKVLPGKADKSYGLHVARLAGLPEPINKRAEEILASLERENPERQTVLSPVQLDLFSLEHPVLEELRKIDPDEITPKEALLLLYKLKEMV
ncbi:DNA mismatch repair protein MutS [Thermosyntropha lipolytica DSM 11003]|uniref:DNA mismatch repair protein MutS n=1 Tax=Thermosyntropha lipolytica DSM 11003 TaxID=1123382 RepID=A0A1M5PLL0_9FIRM|nr:DNA mismatch repair protein MutS [Thermosyntropha lipolytica]SHH02586.1 DNA mismatch repair protein MutS [Thermosyntropha lipolytica DSM 11003]